MEVRGRTKESEDEGKVTEYQEERRESFRVITQREENNLENGMWLMKERSKRGREALWKWRRK